MAKIAAYKKQIQIPANPHNNKANLKKKNFNPFKFLFLLLPIVLCLIRRKPIELIFAQNYRKYI